MSLKHCFLQNLKIQFCSKVITISIWKFGGISHKFPDKNEILIKISPAKLFMPINFEFKMAEFSPDEYNMWENQVEEYFCKVLNIGDIMLILA